MISRRSPHLLAATLTICLSATLAGFLAADDVVVAADSSKKAVATGTAEPAAPQGENKPEKESVPSRLKAAMLKKYDTNGNGKIDEDERDKFLADRKQRAGANAPPNAGPNAEAMRQRALKQLDKDGDGKLSDEERQAGREQARKMMQQALGGDGANFQELLKQFDKDGDGQLSDEERQAARRAFQDRAGRKGKKSN